MRKLPILALLSTFIVACGGRPFSGADTLLPVGDAGPADSPVEASQPAEDAPAVLDSPVDGGAAQEAAPGDVGGHPDGGVTDGGVPAVDSATDSPAPPTYDAGGGEGGVCDLKPCQCGGAYVALCCNGPCPPGFEGLTCYCGECRFPKTYEPDAGRCE